MQVGKQTFGGKQSRLVGNELAHANGFEGSFGTACGHPSRSEVRCTARSSFGMIWEPFSRPKPLFSIRISPRSAQQVEMSVSAALSRPVGLRSGSTISTQKHSFNGASLKMLAGEGFSRSHQTTHHPRHASDHPGTTPSARVTSTDPSRPLVAALQARSGRRAPAPLVASAAS